MLRNITIEKVNSTEHATQVMQAEAEKVELIPLESGNLLVKEKRNRIRFQHLPKQQRTYSIWRQDNTTIGPFPIIDSEDMAAQVQRETKEILVTTLWQYELVSTSDRELQSKIQDDYDMRTNILCEFSNKQAILCHYDFNFFVWDKINEELYKINFPLKINNGTIACLMSTGQILCQTPTATKGDGKLYEVTLIEFKHITEEPANRNKMESRLFNELTLFSRLCKLVNEYLGQDLRLSYGEPVKKSFRSV